MRNFVILKNMQVKWLKKGHCESAFGNPRLTCQTKSSSLYSTAQFKLYARDYILASINTFSPSSQPMLASKDSMLASKGSILASKGSMLSSKGNILSCMILLAIEIDARVRLLARIRDRAVSRCTRVRLHALVYYFTRDLN